MRKFLSIALLAAAGAACSDSTGPDAVAGTYSVTTVNGATPPATVFDQGPDNRTQLLSGTLNLNAEVGTYSISLSFRVTSTGATSDVTETENGTWTVSGNTISFTSSDPTDDPRSATVSDDRLTMVTDFGEGPATLVFGRR